MKLASLCPIWRVMHAVGFISHCEERGRPSDWSTLKELLVAAFAPPYESEQNRLLFLRARQRGTLDEYVTHFGSLCLGVRNVDELTRTQVFVEGLTPALRWAVRREHPATVQDAVRAARTALEFQMSEESRQFPAIHERRPRRYPARPLASELSNSSTDYERRRQQRRCFLCGEPGHIAKFCPAAKSPQSPKRQPPVASGAQLLAEPNVLLSCGGMHCSSNDSLVHQLLVFQAYVRDTSLTCLIDTGASHNFLSADLSEKLCLTICQDPASTQVVLLADGVQHVTSMGGANITLEVRNLSFDVRATVIPLRKYDLILGMPWLRANKPVIDFSTNTITFPATGRFFTAEFNVSSNSNPVVDPLPASESNTSNLETISIKEAKAAIKTGGVCLMVTVESPECHNHQQLLSIEAAKFECPDFQRRDLRSVLERHKDIFPDSLPDSLPPFRTVNHDIELEPGHTPPSRPPFRLSHPELNELQKQLEDLLRRGFIEPSKSPYGAAVFFVKKADGTLRLVCDWRQLNKITVKTQACLPSIDDLFDVVQGAKYFSKLDLMSGYHQVRVNPKDIPKTAINTSFGQFQFTVMGFGLTNAPATFMALMNSVLRPFVRRCVVVFLDDILIYSKTWEDHLQDIDNILSALHRESLFCKPSKCVFATSEVKFLGHIITGQTLAPDPDKLAAIKNWPIPSSVKEILQFLGFSNYFRRFIRDYSIISRPLEKLTGKYARFSWSRECQEAFENLQVALITAPVLLLPNVQKPFRIVVDASDVAIGGVLLQQDSNDFWHPVAFTSRRFRAEELNYSLHERETLAVIHALRVWKLYLFQRFELITDNQVVSCLKSKKDLSKREARWLDFLAEFDMDIVLKPGKDNIADAISRQIFADRPAELGVLEGQVSLDSDMLSLLKKGYQSDKYMNHIIECLKSEVKSAYHSRYHWSASNQKLYLLDSPTWRLCIPAGKLRLHLLELCHDNISAGHPGRDKTYSLLSRVYYWPGMYKQVTRYVKSCDVCQHTKGDLPPQNLLQPLPLPKAPWQDLGMDLIVGLPTTSQGHDAIITFVDRLTKYAHFIPTSSSLDAIGAADLYISHVYRLHGLSLSIVCDRDPRFTADMFRHIFKQLKVQLKFTTSNHPQCDGQTERTNRIIAQILRTSVNHRQTNWEEILPICELAYNNTVQSSVKETPFFLNHGWHPRVASDLLGTADSLQTTPGRTCNWLQNQESALKIARDALQEAMVKQAGIADRTRASKVFKVGDLVMVHCNFISTSVSRDQPCAKLRHRWFGPFKVLSVLSATTVKLDFPSSIRVHPVF